MELILKPQDVIDEPSTNSIRELKVSDFPMSTQNLINQVLNLGGKVFMRGQFGMDIYELFVEKA